MATELNAQGRYEKILRAIIDGLLEINIGTLGITQRWWNILRTRSVNAWVQKISNMTTPECKRLLSLASAPAIEAFSLLSYTETKDPGVYFSVISETDLSQHFFVYVGSASSPTGGLQQRIQQHQNPKYSAYQA